MKKNLLKVVAIILLVGVVASVLVACNAKNTTKALEKEDYTVYTLDEENAGKDSVANTLYKVLKTDEDFKEGVFGIKENDYVIAVWFEDKDSAEEFSESITVAALKKTGAECKVKGKIVYVGTEQGIKDAR